jgi:hypothetical protein
LQRARAEPLAKRPRLRPHDLREGALPNGGDKPAALAEGLAPGALRVAPDPALVARGHAQAWRLCQNQPRVRRFAGPVMKSMEL